MPAAISTRSPRNGTTRWLACAISSSGDGSLPLSLFLSPGQHGVWHCVLDGPRYSPQGLDDGGRDGEEDCEDGKSQPGGPRYYVVLNTSWMLRGVLPCVVIRPNVDGVATSEPGVPNTT